MTFSRTPRGASGDESTGGSTCVTVGRQGPAEVCITCGDVALELTVVELCGSDALCEAADGGRERVAIDFVASVGVGDRLLVHAAVALEKVG